MEISQESSEITQVRPDGGGDSVVVVEGVRNGQIPVTVLEAVPVGFPDGLDVVFESKKGVMKDSKVFCFSPPTFIDSRHVTCKFKV